MGVLTRTETPQRRSCCLSSPLLLLLLLLLSWMVVACAGTHHAHAFPEPYPRDSFGVPQWSELGTQNDDASSDVQAELLFAEVDEATTTEETEYDEVPAAVSTAGGVPFVHKRVEAVIHHQFVRGHLLRVPSPGKSFSILPPSGGCPGFRRTSITAEDARCAAATNAGFFDIYRGHCLGNLVSNGEVLQADSSTRNANFGVTKDGKFVYGYLTRKQIEDMQFANLMTGVTWLLRKGKIYLDESINRERPTFEFVWIKAPRVAIGNNESGELMILEVDGDEPLNKGLNLYEFAELAKSKGMVNAINIDGWCKLCAYPVPQGVFVLVHFD